MSDSDVAATSAAGAGVGVAVGVSGGGGPTGGGRVMVRAPDAERSFNGVLATNGAQGIQGTRGNQAPPTTTISTIAVQAGHARIVIALLQSKEHIQLKILEMEPDLTRVGTTLSEALELQKQHEDVLTKLQGKQSPVEELLNQADQLISSQNPRAEVYAAMAESLGLAWKDLNSQLEHRKQLLDQSVAFQTRASEYSERMDKAEKEFQDGALANDADSVRKLLQRHHDTKKGILEASMHTLNEGQSLLARLREIAAQGNGDSRPGNLKQSASTACYQVERVMEELHDRRRLLEDTWAKKKSLLEQCLQLVLLYGDLEQVEELLKTKGKEFIQNTNVGDSPATSEIMQHEHGKVENEAKQIQDKCVRLVRTAEQFVSNNHYAGGKAQTRAYKVLEDCAVLCSRVEARKKLLASAVAFFRLAQTALTKLDQLEVQLATNDTRSGSALSQQQTHILHTIEDVTSPAIQEGHNLLDSTNRNDPGVQGVVRTVAELEERRRKLESLCSSQRIETLEQTEAFKSFCANFNSIYYWVVNHCEAFLQGHQDMGSVLAMAKDFLHAHEQLQNDVQNKSFEVEALMRSMQNLLKSADPDADQVEQMSEDLRTHWIHMKTILEDRIRVARSYLNFHKLAVNLANELDALEDLIRGLIDGSLSESALKDSEEKWLGIQQMHLQMKNTGKNFIFDAKKSKDPHLDIQRAILCVDTLLEHFQTRQKELAHLRENWQSHMSQENEIKSQWHKVSVEVQTTIEWVLKFEAELYPILIVDTVNIQNIIFNLERKMESSQQLSKKSEADLEEKLKIVEAAARSSDSESDMKRIANELREVLKNFQRKFTEYQILLNMLVSYFKRLYELEKMVENLEVQYTTTLLPLELSEVELLLREHEASRQAVQELFKFTHLEREQLISRIRQQEPAVAAAHDEDRVTKLVHLTHQHWEKSWQEHKTHIEQHLQLCHFNHDLKQINNHLNELTSQLSSIRGNYGESVNSAKATSQAFIQFEKTIELLERKIRVFVSSAEKMLTDRHFESSRIQQELDDIQNKWSSFHMQVGDNRKKITQSIEYFTLVEEIEEWFMEGSKLLITIARKSSQCRTPAEANDLLKEVDNYLKSSEAKQAERLRKVTQMSIQLSGGVPDKANLVAEKNREMMDSFAVINKELTTLKSNLKTLDEQRQQQIKEKEEVDAALVAAKAEAAAARASATAAEEARRAAETAARAIPMVLEKTEIRTFETVQKRTPSPKPPAVPPKPVAPEFTIPLKSAEVVEGVKFKFECRVKGVPTPEVSWYKDTMHILNNPDYPTTFENGVCTLIIEETFSEDTATFTCKATNPAGSAETSGQLTVKESRPVEEFTAPEFVKELQSGTVKVGDVHELECRVTGHPLPVVSWFKNDVCVDNCPDYVITFNNGTCILRFEELFLQDGAKYACNAVNQVGQASSVATLTVEPRESTEVPVFVQALSNVMARAGQKLRLECCVKGVPQPEITWLHNNKPIQENRDVKVQFDGDKATLVVTEAFPKDAGTYLAIAKNRAGEATSSCTVAVKGRLPLETSDSELPSDLEPVKPRILQQLKNMTVSEGFKTRMDCIIVGQPEPEVIWYHDGKPVKESNDFQLLFEGDKCSLVIREAFAEDAGEYKVVAINSAGEASSSCRLGVDSPSEHGNLEHSERNVTLVIENMVTPNFTKLLSDVTCTEGENLVLECVASGVPAPTFSWHRENQLLSPSEDISINTNALGRSLLQLRNSKTDHSGMYSVKASNKCGDAKSFCHVTVCRPPREVITKVFAKSDVGSSPPQFTQLFTDETVAIGEPVRFTCNISGNPYPKVQWYFKGEPITPRDFQITADGEKHSLAISSAKPEHKGRFTCTAENDRGKSTCAAVLDITEPLALSINHHKDESHDHRVGHYGGTKTTSIMESKFTSKTTEVRSGSGAEFHHLSAREEHAIKKFGDQPAEEMHSSERDEYHKSTDEGLTVKQIPKLMDKVGDVQHTVVGSKLQFPILESTGKMTLPPKFSRPVMSVVVHEGEPAKLEGHVHGYPEPSVKWYKNSVEIVRSDWRTVFENGVATMSIPKPCVKDSGRYTCTARNTLGTASSTADLLIKPIQEAPQFIQCLRAQVVKSGDCVEMEVEVSGMPEPKVSWYKNGMPIEKSDGYRVKRDGNKHTLIIQKAVPDDAGKFMVKAENPAGEAQCIADFLVEDPALVNVEKIAYERVSVIEEKKQTMSKFSTASTPTVTRIEFPPSPSPRPQRTPTPPKELAPALPEYTAPASKFWKPRKVPRAEKAILEPTFSADESFPLPSDVEYSEPELALAAPKLVKVKMAPLPPPKPIAKPEAAKATHISSVKSPVQKPLQSPVDDIHLTPSPKPVSKQDGFFPVQPTPSTSAATTPSMIIERVPPPVSPKPTTLSSVKFTKTETTVTTTSSMTNEQISSPTWKPTREPTTAWKPVKAPTPVLNVYEDSSKKVYVAESSFELPPLKNLATQQCIQIGIDSVLQPGPPPEFGFIRPDSVTRQSSKVVPPAPPTPTSMPRGGVPVYPGLGDLPKQRWSDDTTIVRPKPSLAPVFVKLLADKDVWEGEEVLFECIVHGDPEPCIEWQKDGKVLQDSTDFQISYSRGACRLTVPEVYRQDGGTFTCMATNSAGSASTSAVLNLKAMDGNIPPGQSSW